MIGPMAYWPLRMAPAAGHRTGARGAYLATSSRPRRAKIAAQSKANHLAYIGDAEIGQRVNVGAGNHHLQLRRLNSRSKTVIEDDVHRFRHPVGGAGSCRTRCNAGRRTTLTKRCAAGCLDRIGMRQADDPAWLGTAMMRRSMDWGFIAFAVAKSTLSLAAGGAVHRRLSRYCTGCLQPGTEDWPAGASFCWWSGRCGSRLSRGPEFRRAAIQLIAGLLLVTTAGGLILGWAPTLPKTGCRGCRGRQNR